MERLHLVQSLTNLYGNVSKYNLLKIMNDITDENMTHDAFDEWLKKNRWLLKDIKVTNDRLIHKQFKSVHYSHMELKEKDSHPFYIPTKSEISDYQHLLIGTHPPLLTELHDFMKLRYRRERKAIKVTYDILVYCRSSHLIDELPVLFHKGRLKIEKSDEAYFLKLLESIINHSRMIELNGYTPNERDWKIKVDVLDI